MSTWWPARRRLAAMAVLTAVLTGAAGAALGASGGHAYGAALYVLISLGAVVSPAAIAAQVVTGQLLAGSVLVGPGGADPWMLVPMVAGVVATAELLAAVARLDTPLERDPSDDLRRAGQGAVVGAATFAVVVVAGELPGPTGIPAVALASGACLLLGWSLVRSGR